MPRPKIQSALAAAPLLRCPLCAAPLRERPPASLVCSAGHCFDVAAKGYINFAPQQKPLKYTRQLFESRQRVLQGAFYAPLTDALCQLLCEKGCPLRVLDAGCGDGHYAREIARRTGAQVFALDLCKEAIALACRGEHPVLWLVADLTRIPLADASVDAVLDILSPAHYGEFTRVLRPDGLLLKVLPGERYLCELRQAASAQLRHKTHSNRQVVQHFDAHFATVQRQRLCHTLPITPDQRADFLAMTPLLLGVDTAALDVGDLDRITIDVEILVGQLRP